MVYLLVPDFLLMNAYKTVEHNDVHLIRRVQTIESKRTAECEAEKQ